MSLPAFDDLASPGFRPRRILIVKPSALGDIVHTLPVLRLLHHRFADAKIDWLVAPAFASLLREHPDLNEVLLFDRKNIHRVGDTSTLIGGGVVKLAGRLAERRYDLAIDLQGLLRSAMLSFATHAPVRVGFAYAREGAWLGYTHRVQQADAGPERHAVERYLDVAEAIGCVRGPIEFRFAPTSPADVAHVDRLLAPTAGRPFAVMLPGTNWATKRWPVGHYARLATLVRERLDLFPCVAGGPDAAPLAAQMSEAIDLSNRTTLPQLVALLRRATLVIANDSGPMHIAAALGRPLVTIFGPTNPVRTGPYARLDTVVRLNIVCSPCYSRTCSHTSCMEWLTPEDVLREASARLNLVPLPSTLGRG